LKKALKELFSVPTHTSFEYLGIALSVMLVVKSGTLLGWCCLGVSFTPRALIRYKNCKKKECKN